MTQSHTKVALGSWTHPKMSTTDYQQTSDLKELHPTSRSDKEKHNINPTGASAEQIVRISSN